MPLDAEAERRLAHLLEAGDAILTFTAGKTFDDYRGDRVLRLAVERLFTIVGEALREAARADASVERAIPEYRMIVDFRNVVVHNYVKLFDEAIWHIRTVDLPILLERVRALLSPA